MMKHLAMTGFLVAATALLLLASSEPAHADETAAEGCLTEWVETMTSGTDRIRATDTFSAEPKVAVNYRITLYKGLKYLLFGCSENGKADLDYRLFDEDGNQVDVDMSPDGQPLVSAIPGKTGEYILQVTSYQIETASNFALAVIYGPAPEE